MIEKKLVIVLGMHRSGTSAITSALRLLDVDLGENLHKAGPDNPKGFWEDEDCLKINEALLKHLGSSYDGLAFSWSDLGQSSELQELQQRAVDIVKQRLATSGSGWGFKDPRTCRLLAFWQEVFRLCGCAVHYVIALRNPLSVVQSLEKRNSIPAEKTYLLWLQHTLPSLLLTQGAPRLVVDYDRFMEQPYEQLSRIAKMLDTAVPPRDARPVLDFEKHFLDRDLRNSHFGQAELALDKRALPTVKTVYDLASLAATDKTAIEDPAFIEKLELQNKLLMQASPIIGYANSLEQERSKLWASALLHAEELEDAERRHAKDLENVALQYEDRIEQLKATIGALTQGLADAKRELRVVLESTSWKVSAPVRVLQRLWSAKRHRAFRLYLETELRKLWHRLPIRVESKLRLKESLFRRFPSAFRRSDAYRAWYRLNGPSLDSGNAGFASTSGSPVGDDGLYVSLTKVPIPDLLAAKVIAFYLPQFHPIKQNDEWWGQGFTEWTNVKPALPQFEGHYQPHVPDELGYYSLLDKQVQRRQIELAKLYGVSGFCFYYYWFAGTRLLEQPIENYLQDETLDHPFCLCWANENWSRRWDGKDSQILIAQEHSPSDDIAVAEDLSRYVKDRRYIRIDGRPLILVYRPSLLPSAKETAARWRQWFRDQGIGEIYLAYTQSFEAVDPAAYGFDAAIEFPPNNSAPPNITHEVNAEGTGFQGMVYDWSIFPKRASKYSKVGYKLFRSVCPSWDNTARRKSKGTIFLNSTPDAYRQWLEAAVVETVKSASSPDEKLIFVNAWNEWAEGAHLEPDQKYGYGWLDATRRALTGEPSDYSRPRMAVISHDAHPHGAQFLALGMVRSLANDLKFDVDVILLGDGRLRPDFARYATVHDLLPGDDFAESADKMANTLWTKGVRHAIVNTTVAGSFIKALAAKGIYCISLIHEMPGVIAANNLEDYARSIAESADRVVFPAPLVEDGFRQFARVAAEKRVLRPQGLWRRNHYRAQRSEIRAEIRRALGVPSEAPLILAVGYADRRKGVDLFVRAGLKILEQHPDAVFVWIGHWDETCKEDIEQLTKDASKSFFFLGYEPRTARYHAAADVFALTSREDPFPNVVLESFDAGVPVVAFAGTGGGADLVANTGGRLAEPENATAFAEAVIDLLDDRPLARSLGEEGADLVDANYAFRDYLFDLCALANIQLPRISVVVPNYNYAHHLRERLNSIVGQTLPIFELIILDDASTDDSVEVITAWTEENNVECRLLVNSRNSGSVFDQWARGVELARGEFVWIAEADDLSTSQFLETVIAPMERDPDVNLSYCESQQIDENGSKLARSYDNYRNGFADSHWDAPYVAEGTDELAQYLAVQNTIPNVSGVLFRREAIANVLREHIDEIRALRRAGDWLTYFNVLKSGKIAFSPRALNFHRRHRKSVVGGSNAASLVDEIAAVQKIVAKTSPIALGTAERASAYLQQLREQFRL